MTDIQKPADRKPATTHQKRSRVKHQIQLESGVDHSNQPEIQTQTPVSSARDEDDQTYSKEAAWFLYIVECKDGSLYTGVTTDLERRVKEHNGCPPGKAARGAAYTRARRPVKLVYKEHHPDRSDACKREFELKRLSRNAKLNLINSQENPDKRKIPIGRYGC